MLSPPTRVDSEIYEAAKTEGDRVSRSAAQQLTHWARVGRQLELASSTSWEQIGNVLDGEADYDELGDREQAIVRAVWAERIDDLAARVDLTGLFKQQGRATASVADADGNLVVVELDAAGKPTRPKAKARKR